jgi:hypothetical protein
MVSRSGEGIALVQILSGLRQPGIRDPTTTVLLRAARLGVSPGVSFSDEVAEL